MLVTQTNTAEEVPAPSITFILVEPWSKGEKLMVNTSLITRFFINIKVLRMIV